MIALDEITVFNDIKERLALITPEQIERTGKKLREQCSHEPTVGVVVKRSTRALFTLAESLRKASLLELAQASAADHDEIEKDLRQRGALLDMLEDVVIELFWTQAKIDLGFLEIADVGLRAGWTMVKQESTTRPGGLLLELMRGNLPGLPGLGS